MKNALNLNAWLKDWLRGRRQLHWVTNADGEHEIRKECYLVLEKNYKTLPVLATDSVRRERIAWLEKLGHIWGGDLAESWRLSGAVGLEVLDDGGSQDLRRHTNTDIIVINNSNKLLNLIDAVRPEGYYPFRRCSGKLWERDEIKYHIFYPVTMSEILSGEPLRNLELGRVIREKNTIGRMIPQNHLKLYIHVLNEDFYTCAEDKNPIKYPAEFLNGVPYTLSLSGRIFVARPEYMHLKLKTVIEKKESEHPKHKLDFERLEQIISSGKYLPCEKAA